MAIKKNNRLWILILSILCIVLLLWYFQAIVAYILISLVLSILGRPIVDMLGKIKIKRFHLPPGPCALLTLVLFYTIIILFMSQFLPLISHQADIISRMDPNSISQSVQEEFASLDAKLLNYHIFKPGESTLASITDGVSKAVNIANLSDIFNSALGFTGNIFVALFSISFISFFFMKDKMLFTSLILLVTPDDHLEQMKHILRDSKVLITRYFVGLLIEILLVSTCLSIGLYIVGVQNAMLIGFLAGILIIVPYVGSIVGTLLGILLGISTELGADFHLVIVPLITKIFIVFLIVHIIDPLIFQPIIYAKSVHAHPLEIFLILLIAGRLGGIPGMIVAVPFYTIFRIIAKEFLSGFKLVQRMTRNM